MNDWYFSVSSLTSVSFVSLLSIPSISERFISLYVFRLFSTFFKSYIFSYFSFIHNLRAFLKILPLFVRKLINDSIDYRIIIQINVFL